MIRRVVVPLAIMLTVPACADVHRQPPVAELVSPVVAFVPSVRVSSGVCAIFGISSDGRVIGFRSSAQHVEGGYPPPACWPYVFDRDTGVVHALTFEPDFPGYGTYEGMETLSPDGETVFYGTDGESGWLVFHALRWREGVDTSTLMDRPADSWEVSGDGSMLVVGDSFAWDWASGGGLEPIEAVIALAPRYPVRPVRLSSTGDWLALSFSGGDPPEVGATLVVGLRSGVAYEVPWVGRDAGEEVLHYDPVFLGPSALLVATGAYGRSVLDLETGAMTPHPLADLTTELRASSDDGATFLVQPRDIVFDPDRGRSRLWRDGVLQVVRFLAPSGAPLASLWPWSTHDTLLSGDGRWLVFGVARYYGDELVREAVVIPVEF